MGIVYGYETADGYEPSLLHRWLKPRLSGNAINGVGETAKRRARPIFHLQTFRHPWGLVQLSFILREIFHYRHLMRPVIVSRKLDRMPPVSVAARRVEASPAEWSRRIKEQAKALGFDDARIARMRPEFVFEGETIAEKWAIVLASRMNYDEVATMRTRRFARGAAEVMGVYLKGHLRVRKLADWLRQQGWNARGYGTPMLTPLNILPAALAAGMGELGKHGSIIHPELGSMFRLAYVLTDMPLVEDGPMDFGADSFCQNCRACATECPADAITHTKQWVRGVERWYVDFDKCVPYFSEHYGCGICLAACPWSRPGVASNLLAKIAKRRAAA